MYKYKKRRLKKIITAAFVLFFISAGTTAGVLRYQQPVPAPTVHHVLSIATDSNPAAQLPWPEHAEASIGTVQDGILLSSPGKQPALPTASTAKLITVLTVLKEKPISSGEQGPLITMTQRDMQLYSSYAAVGGSLAAVRQGEQLSQYQMLQGILIRSSNNLADGLALWAFGSMEKYQAAAQKYVKELGMTNTTIGPDASGFSPLTTSTANDLTMLGIAAMKHEVVREIVQQTTSSLPTDGTKPSTNWMLGQNGVVGIKTGNIPQIGGVFIIASEHKVEGEQPITIVGTVQGEATTYGAIIEADHLAEAIKPLFVRKTLVKKGDVVARIETLWGESSDVVADRDISTFGWKYALTPNPEVELQSKTPFQKGALLGKLTIGEHSCNLIAAGDVHQPAWQWRLAASR